MRIWFEKSRKLNAAYKLGIAIILGSLLLALSLISLVAGSPTSPPTILEVIPTQAPNNFDIPLVITGTGFQVTLSGTLVLAAPIVRLGDIVLPVEGQATSSTLTAIVPWGLNAGIYPISIENADGTTVTLASAFTVTAGLDVWTTGGPYGGSVKRLEMDQNVTSTLYANLDMVGLFKSENNGESWYNVFPGYVTQFTLKPDNPQTIYLSGDIPGEHRLFRSTNGGVDWETIWEGRPWALGVSPADPDLLYFGSGAAITRSLDGGDTWEWAGNGIPDDAWISILAVHPITPDIAYTGNDTTGQIYKTTNGGTNWTAAGDSFGETWWSVLAIDPHDPQRLYASGWHGAEFIARSLDGGNTWETMPLAPGERSISDIQFDSTISGTLYALASSGIFKSTDAGDTWTLYSDGISGWSLLLHPQTGLPFYIGHGGKAALRSDNDGLDWQVRNQGLAGLHVYEVAPSPTDPRYIYLAADDGGGFVSNNGGQSWRAVVEPEHAFAAAAHPYTPTVAFFGERDIYKTVDGGQTWMQRTLPGVDAYVDGRVSSIAIDPGDPRVMYAGVGSWDMTGGAEYGGLYRSLDEGMTWEVLMTTYPISPVTQIVIDPVDSQTIYVTTGRRWEDTTDRGSGILKTTDGGATWEFINQGLTAFNITRLAITPDDPQVLYAGANLSGFVENGGVFKSIDGGAHWTPSRGWLRISGLEVDPLVTDTVYAGSYWAGIFVSTDAGGTWNRVEGPLGRLSSLCLKATEAPSRTVIYAGVSGGLVNLTTARATSTLHATLDDGQFYGSGIYQLTIDRRARPNQIFLPFVIRN